MFPYKKMIPGIVKKAAHQLIWPYRKSTWQSRTLPDFMIVGAQKAGTTSLFDYLRQHSQILPSYAQEIHFFDGGLDPYVDTYAKGERWYRAQFQLQRKIKPQQKSFDVSPLYLFNPLAAGRIFELLPKVKIIALLRNPTERAISHYFHEHRKSRELSPIIEAMQAEEQRLESVIQAQDYKSDTFIHLSYKTRGLYKAQLERYLHYFPRQQILAVNSDDLFGNPKNTLRRIFDFVEVDADFKVKNLAPSNTARNRKNVSPEVYQYLNDFFLPHNQALYELIDEDFNW